MEHSYYLISACRLIVDVNFHLANFVFSECF